MIISALERLFSPLPVIFGVPFVFLDSIVAVQTAMISYLYYYFIFFNISNLASSLLKVEAKFKSHSQRILRQLSIGSTKTFLIIFS